MRWLALSLVLLLAVEARAGAAPCSLDRVAAEVTALGGPALDRIPAHVELGDREGSVVYVMASGEVIGPRVVRASSCGELAKSLALVIVMSLRADEPREPASVTRDVTIERPALDMPIAIEMHSGQRPAKPFEALLGGAVSRRPALVLGGRWHRGAVSLGLELQVLSPLTIDVEAGGSVEVTRTAAMAAPCAHIKYLAVCGLASAGMISGEGHQLAEAAHVRRASLAVGGRVELDVSLADRLSLRLHLDGLQALDRTRFLVDEMAVWTSDSRELWLGAGVMANFP